MVCEAQLAEPLQQKQRSRRSPTVGGCPCSSQTPCANACYAMPRCWSSGQRTAASGGSPRCSRSRRRQSRWASRPGTSACLPPTPGQARLDAKPLNCAALRRPLFGPTPTARGLCRCWLLHMCDVRPLDKLSSCQTTQASSGRPSVCAATRSCSAQSAAAPLSAQTVPSCFPPGVTPVWLSTCLPSCTHS